jgi:hypothetical protein
MQLAKSEVFKGWDVQNCALLCIVEGFTPGIISYILHLAFLEQRIRCWLNVE